MSATRLAPMLVLSLLVAFAPTTAAAQSDSGEMNPSFRRVFLGTTVGAVIGTAAIAGLPTLLAYEADDSSGPISGAGIVFALTAPIGWWLGQSAGASWGSGEAGSRVRMRSLLLPAAVWTVAGVFLSTRTGGGVGVVFPIAALAGTSWSAYHRAHETESPNQGFALFPIWEDGRGLGLTATVRLRSP